MKRAAIFGWGLVAPGAATIDEFAQVLASGSPLLEPFHGFGKDSFLVGRPRFDFSVYEPWVAERFPSSRSKQLAEKMDLTTLYAIGAFIQALGQNQGLEQQLRDLKTQAHVYIGNALGAHPTTFRTSVELYRAQRRWNRFWCHPERNQALAEYEQHGGDVPVTPPQTLSDPDERELAEDAWFSYWAERSTQLQEYLRELTEIESPGIEGDVDAGKMKLMRDKRRHLAQLQEKWNAPPPPWSCVSPNLIWNVPNTPASQISMLGQITGLAFAPVAACSTFGVSLKLALDAIQRGEAKFVVMGSADPPPHPLTVGAFYSARVMSADDSVSKPLSRMKGTHVAGGSCIWIIGDLEYGLSCGFKPLGIEPLAVGVSSDADHIITPSKEGPRVAMRSALEQAQVDSSEIVSWDLHATATPGDFLELENLQSIVPPETIVSARKGTFGHGMGVGGGWELTAQYLGMAQGQLYPTSLHPEELHPTISSLGQKLVLDEPIPAPSGPVGKLSMGVGGINACVISRPWKKEE